MRSCPRALLQSAAVCVALGLIPACGARGELPPTTTQEEAIRVLVYNIHAGTDATGEPNLERVSELVLLLEADIVLLQEVDRETERSGEVDQLAELEHLTGFHGAFGRTLDYQGGEYGIAMLSRWPIRSDTLIPLPVDVAQERAGGSYEPRGALRAEVAAPAGSIGVLNTHLAAFSQDHYRRQEMATVRREADRLRDDYGVAVVGGDFNAEPDSEVIRTMLDAGWIDGWGACGESGAGLTYPADRPERRIDYLFLSPDLTCDSARVLSTGASDHRPLLVRVRPGW